MEDRHLVEQVTCHGDEQSFAVIVRRHTPHILSQMIGMTHRMDMAREITQMTFVKAYDRLDSFHGTDLAPWLSSIATHIAIDMLSKEQRQRGHPIDRVRESEICPTEEYSQEHEEQLQRMERAISMLPDTDRQIIHLHYFKRLKTETIARQLDMTQSNVLIKLHRIRERLKKLMENEQHQR